MWAYFDPNHNQQNTCSSFQSLAEVFTIGTATGTCDPTTCGCSNVGPARVWDCASQGGPQGTAAIGNGFGPSQ